MARRVTIADIAQQAQVSTSAVSYALNQLPGVSEPTRRRILAIADTMGWRPDSSARALQSSRTNAVGLVLLHTQQPQTTTPDFLMTFLPGLQTRLAEDDVLLVLHLVPDARAAAEVYREWQGSRRVDGVIVLNPTVSDPRLTRLAELRLPAVVVGDTRRISPIPCVWTDDTHAVKLIIDHLTALGHTRIGRVGVRANYLHTRTRDRAFVREMRRAGLPVEFNGVTSPTVSEERLLTPWLEAAEPPTALIHEDPLSTVNTLELLGRSGVRVPTDISIVGWDDSPWSSIVSPALTVLRRDLFEYGRLVATQLLAAVDGRPVGHRQGSTAELLVRESTAPPRAAGA